MVIIIPFKSEKNTCHGNVMQASDKLEAIYRTIRYIGQNIILKYSSFDIFDG